MYFFSLHFTRQKPRRKVPPPLSMDSYSESPTYPYSSSVQYSVDTGQLLDQNFALMLGLFHRWVFKTSLRCWNYKSAESCTRLDIYKRNFISGRIRISVRLFALHRFCGLVHRNLVFTKIHRGDGHGNGVVISFGNSHGNISKQGQET